MSKRKQSPVPPGPFGGNNWLMDLAADVVTSWATQAGAAATGTAAALSSAAATKGVVVKADDDNTGSVYVGTSVAVTANSGASTSGYRLKAGQSLFLPVSNANLVFLIGSASGQNYVAAVC